MSAADPVPTVHRSSARQGIALLGLGVLAVVLSFTAPQLPLLAALGGPFGLLVGLALLGCGATALLAPQRLAAGRRWLAAFRRTRPFWGGLWLLVGGWAILRLSMTTAHLVVVAGLTGFGGWLTGGGMILCGFAAWAAPSQRYVIGVVGTILAVSALIVSNLGGLGIGTLLGILGGAMTLAWGPKKPARPRGPRQVRVGLVGLERRAQPAAAGPAGTRPQPAPQPAAQPASQPEPRPRPRPRPGTAPLAARPADRSRAGA